MKSRGIEASPKEIFGHRGSSPCTFRSGPLPLKTLFLEHLASALLWARHREITENTEGRGVGARHCLALFCGRTPITCHCEPPQAAKQSPFRPRRGAASAATPPRSDITALLWKAGASRRRATLQAVGAVSTAAEAAIACHCEPPQAAKQSHFMAAGDCFGGYAASQQHHGVALESGKSPQGDFASSRCSFNCRREPQKAQKRHRKHRKLGR